MKRYHYKTGVTGRNLGMMIFNFLAITGWVLFIAMILDGILLNSKLMLEVLEAL